MSNSAGDDDCDDARAQRKAGVDEHDIGTRAFDQVSSSMKAGSASGSRGDQSPGFRKRQNPVGGETEGGQERRRIVIVGCENGTYVFLDHVVRFGPSGVA